MRPSRREGLASLLIRSLMVFGTTTVGRVGDHGSPAGLAAAPTKPPAAPARYDGGEGGEAWPMPQSPLGVVRGARTKEVG